MSEQYGFKTAFRGFDRTDVLTYIDKLRLQLHESEEAHAAELQTVRDALAAVEARLAEVAVAEQTAAQRAAQLEEAEQRSAALSVQVAELTERLAAAEKSAAAGDELQGTLTELRADLKAARESESALTAQLAETHQAVAALWQEKEQLERKVSAAAAYADTSQALAAEFKATLAGTVAAEETPAAKTMERWLF